MQKYENSYGMPKFICTPVILTDQRDSTDSCSLQARGSLPRYTAATYS